MSTRRAAITLACAATAAVALAAPARAASPEEELAEKYAPVVRVVAQEEECGYGEPYVPTDVDLLMRNEEVLLRGPWDAVNVVKIAPAATDLTGKVGYHLDFPGDALEPGCTYEKWSKRLTEGTRPTVYARVATESGKPGKLALQYWLFYVFNDFNNKHEGDWEMIQLLFDADSAEKALGESATSVGYSQHEGAERARWGDDKLEIVSGSHPVVYAAAGSHANYFESALYLGRSGAQGVGCDDTSEPSRDLRPTVAFVPTNEAEHRKTYPWLGFAGHWGEMHPAFYNGPTGPNLKRQWTAPISWSEESWHESAFAIPAGGKLGTSATDFFCEIVARGSDILTKITRNPPAGLLVLAAIAALLAFVASRTTWSVSSPLRLARRRAWGQIANSARLLYRARFGLFVRIGLVFVPLGVLISLVQYLLFQLVLFAPLVDTAGESNVAVAGLAVDLGLLLTVGGLTIVQAATAYAMKEIDEGRPVSATGAYRAAIGRWRPLLGALLVASVVVAVLSLAIVAIPVAIWVVVRWSLLAQAVQLEGLSARQALRRSGKLVRHHWWRVATITLFVTGLGLLAGPLLGVLMLFATSASFNVVNLVAGLVYVIALPFTAIATTYLYYDLLAREQLEPLTAGIGEPLPAEI